MLYETMFYPIHIDYGNGTLKNGGTIRYFSSPQETQLKEGWICPNCKQRVAPWKGYCDCSFSGHFPVQYKVPKTIGDNNADENSPP